MKIEFAESAVCDLEDIRSYYTEQQIPHVGERFIVEICMYYYRSCENSSGM